MKTNFKGVVPTPAATGNHEGPRGGYPLSDSKGAALQNSPFTQGICPTPGMAETPSREVGTQPAVYSVKDAPGRDGNIGALGLIESHQSNQTFKR